VSRRRKFQGLRWKPARWKPSESSLRALWSEPWQARVHAYLAEHIHAAEFKTRRMVAESENEPRIHVVWRMEPVAMPARVFDWLREQGEPVAMADSEEARK